MGVEYQHWLVVRDLDWLPGPDTVARLLEVFRTWELSDLFAMGDLTGPPDTSEIAVLGPADEVESPPSSLVLQSVEAPTGEAVAQISGDNGNPDPYLSYLAVFLGQHYYLPDSEYLYPDIREPARDRAGNVVEQRYTRLRWAPVDDESLNYKLRQIKRPVFIPVPPAVTPPQTSVAWSHHVANAESSDYGGCFRSGILFDCGKNLPQGLGGAEPLRNRNLVTDFQNAFDTELVEFGIIY